MPRTTIGGELQSQFVIVLACMVSMTKGIFSGPCDGVTVLSSKRPITPALLDSLLIFLHRVLMLAVLLTTASRWLI